MVNNFLQKIIWNFKSVTTVATILTVTDVPTGTWVSSKDLGELNTQGFVNVADELFKQMSWSVGRAVASNTRGPQLESSHWQTLYSLFMYRPLYWKDKNKVKDAGNDPFKNWQLYSQVETFA